ncbi:hypothetical protein M9H77_21880 [Catharanthus roseus]|uniref:Uncharacterized protein n=1 Tax=Catharanthus roseus TaxID=4058 RepID=A0ACC0AQ31_CATRO|nr:hypothetical protein M9H77_21880 [Catharanthus roseus]
MDNLPRRAKNSVEFRSVRRNSSRSCAESGDRNITVRPGARRGDDDIGPVVDRTGRLEATPILFRTRPPPLSHRPYTHIPYDPYGSSQPPPISYDPYAHAPTLPLRAQFFEQLVSSVPVDSSYSATEYEATDYGNPSSDAGLDRDFGEPDMIGSLLIGDEDDEIQPEDDGHDDDDDGESHGDEDEPVPVAPTSSFGGKPAPGKGKGLTGNFINGSIQDQLMEVHWIQSLSLRTVGILLVVYVAELAWEMGLAHLRSFTLHDVELILCVPAYGNVVDLHYSRDQLIAVIQSDLRIIYSGGGQASQVDTKELSGCWPQIGAQISRHPHLLDMMTADESYPTIWVGLMHSSTSYLPFRARQASQQQVVQCQECVYRGINPEKAPTWRSIAEYNSAFQGCSPGHDCS